MKLFTYTKKLSECQERNPCYNLPLPLHYRKYSCVRSMNFAYEKRYRYTSQLESQVTQKEFILMNLVYDIIAIVSTYLDM
jgi:hypothetical protein